MARCVATENGVGGALRRIADVGAGIISADDDDGGGGSLSSKDAQRLMRLLRNHKDEADAAGQVRAPAPTKLHGCTRSHSPFAHVHLITPAASRGAHNCADVVTSRDLSIADSR